MKRALLAALAWLFAITAAAGTTIDLREGWRFRTDAHGEGERSGWTRAVPPLTRAVEVPHTWSVGPDEEFQGLGWYFRRLDWPAGVEPGARLELHFGATFYSARVFLDGAEIGRHEGGHTAWWIDLGAHLKRDRPGLLAIAIDNRPTRDSLPGHAMRLAASGSVWYDWWHHGGLVREVTLRIGDALAIRRQAIDAELAREPAQGPAQVTTRVAIDNAGRSNRRVSLRAIAVAPDGRTVATARTEVEVPARGTASPTLRFTIDRPVLWNIGDGQLYTVSLELVDANGRVLDTRSDTLGLRRIEVRDRKLLVNGKPVRLTDLTRHQDSPWEGLAETRGTILRDWNDLRALHTTLTRPVHYPQHPAVLDHADRHGILLVPEIPMWQFSEAQMKDPRVLALAQQMAAEMIEADGNHPSIFAWSVCNESDTKLPGGLAYVRAMKSHINKLDPKRLVTFADSDLSIVPWPDSRAAHEVDFLMANAYFGTWSGAEASVEPWLDFMDRTYPDKMLIVSEFGFPGPFARDPAEADRKRIENLHSQLDAFAKRDFVAGAIFWTYQDYRSHRNLAAGETSGYVDHGVVDAQRQRRPSYAAYRDRNAPLAAKLAWTADDTGVTGFTAVLRGNDAKQLPSFPLAGYRAEWRMADRDGKRLGEGTQALPPLDAAYTLQGRWPASQGPLDATLTLRIVAPDGAIALDTRLDHRALRLGAAPYPGEPEPAR